MLKGLFVALVTPFEQNNRVWGQALNRLMERNVSEGADGFFVGGSSAECFLLTEEERMEVLEAAAGAAGRIPLIAHVGAISTQEAIRYARRAVALGYDYIAATPPYYYGFTPRQVKEYYYDIARAAGMPVLIYNFPGNTGRPFQLSHPDTRELFCSAAICGVKHTNLDLFQMERIRALNPDLAIMNGYDETMVGGLALGAHGSIGSTFNIMLPLYRRIYDQYRAGNQQEALRLQTLANHSMEALCAVGLIPAIKFVLRLQGYDCGLPRPPFLPLSEEEEHLVTQALVESGCIEGMEVYDERRIEQN